jgi:NAD(P)-dependent dehydrogenase (short-subunit alcohol dehydrogenase family)
MIPYDKFRPAVVVVGASRGIGRAVAKVAAGEHSVVMVCAAPQAHFPSMISLGSLISTYAPSAT